MNELQEHFARALAPEPPFQTDLTTSLDAAVRGGRRRRARAAAGKALALAACAVVVGGVALTFRPVGSSFPGTVAHPATNPSATVSQSPSACADACLPLDYHHGVPMVPADVPDATLDAVVKAVVGSVSEAKIPVGTIAFASPGAATVKTDAGRYSVAVTVWAERFDAAAWASECLPGDGKPCRVQSSSDTELTMATRYLDGSGRAKVRYVADAGATDGTPLTVEVTVDSLAERAGGTKSVGPTWMQLGYTTAGIRTALASTPLP